MLYLKICEHQSNIACSILWWWTIGPHIAHAPRRQIKTHPQTNHLVGTVNSIQPNQTLCIQKHKTQSDETVQTQASISQTWSKPILVMLGYSSSLYQPLITVVSPSSASQPPPTSNPGRRTRSPSCCPAAMSLGNLVESSTRLLKQKRGGMYHLLVHHLS